jgi:protein-S-isoprenylcysteine O-methyltransferase Ste14
MNYFQSMLKIISILGLVVMIAALLGLYEIGVLISPQPLAIALQVIAVALMIWARVTFGRRSFHAAANPTTGGLVTTGPYRYIRHPIYTAACLFGWGAIVVHWSLVSVALGVLLFLGALARLLCEEQLVKQTYPEYLEYSRVTKRMIPYVF